METLPLGWHISSIRHVVVAPSDPPARSELSMLLLARQAAADALGRGDEIAAFESL